MPGRTIETFVFEPPLTVTTPRVGLVPVAVALLAWETCSSVPGLPTRTETLTLRASVCVAAAVPTVMVEAADPAARACEPVAGESSVGVCSIDWSISLSLSTPAEPEVVTTWFVPKGGVEACDSAEPCGGSVEPAEALAVLACVTGPLSPGLATRTTTLTFAGAVCDDEPSAWPPPPVPWAAAAAVASFAWSTGPVSPVLPTMTLTFVLVGEVCEAEADEAAVGSEPGGGSLPVAPAVADAWALFACPTACPLPLPFPLPTATLTFPFRGSVWSAVAPAWALWPFELGAPPATLA